MSHLRYKFNHLIGRTALYNVFVMFFLFFATMNFITREYYWIYIAFIIFLITPKRSVRFNSSSVYLLMLAVSILLFDPNSSNSLTNCIKPFVFFIAYTIGFSFVPTENENRTDEKIIKNIIYVCTYGMLTHFVLNLIKNGGSFERNTIDFWTNEVLSATGQASLACLGVSVIAALLFSETALKQKIIAVILMLTIIMYNLILAGRTLLVMMVIVFIFAFLFRNYYSGKKIIKSVFGVAGLIFLLLIIYNNNIFNIKNIVEESNLYLRFVRKESFGLIDDPRFEYKLLYLRNFLANPFGGTYIRSAYGYYAHDLYLDSYDQYSIFAFIAIIAYIISSFIRLLKCLRSPSLSFNTKQLILCVYTAMNLQFLIEPIIQGIPFLLVAYCIIDGAISQHLSVKP